MMDQMGEEPNWDKCPPDWEDFPEVVITAMNIFNSLGNRVYADVGYTGKDYTNFNFLLDLYSVKKHQKEYVFELILWLEARNIETSQKSLKEQRDKLNRQAKR